MRETDIYAKCIKTHVMGDGRNSHIKGAIYPCNEYTDGYRVMSTGEHNFGDLSHSFQKNGHFKKHFKVITLKQEDVVPPREKKYIEEYIEKLNNIDDEASNFTFSSIEFFGDGSGFIKNSSNDDEVSFDGLDDLDKQLAKIVAQ